MNLLSKVLQAVLEVALPILVSALAAWAVGKAKEIFRKIKYENPDLYYSLSGICSIAVKAAEQIYQGPGRGPEKKQYAIDIIEKWLVSKGLKVDVDVIAAAIEAEVKDMNRYSEPAGDKGDVGL